MKTSKKTKLFVAVAFGLGLGVGGIGGFVINDLVERTNPDAVQEIRQELETQQALENFFSQQQADRSDRNTDTNPSNEETSQ